MNLKELGISLIQNADLKDKVVLVRADHNVVKKGRIHDPYRIDATLGTLYHINAKGGKIILMTHVGRPRDKKTGHITISDNTSVEPIVNYLKSKLHIKIKTPEFYRKTDMGYTGIETSVNMLIKELKNSDTDLIYLPNTRWFTGEESTDQEREHFAHQLAGLADVFVNDAFGSWQPHTSTTGVNTFLPSYAGFLMQKEIINLSRIYKPAKPFTSVVAGSKFDTKINSLFKLLKKSDYLVLGGKIYNAYLCAKYRIHIRGVSEEDIIAAEKFTEFAEQYKDKIIELPLIVESDSKDTKEEGKFRTVDVRDFKEGDKFNFVLDVHPDSFKLSHVQEVFKKSKTIFVNAVMGFTPHFNEGTIALDSLIDTNSDAVKLYGGGDTMQELKRLLPGLYIVALDSPDYYIFTGGGAVLKAIEKESPLGLEPVAALKNRSEFPL